MSRLLGPAVHQAYVYPDFDAALARFAAGGIGPFFVLPEAGGMSLFRGEEHYMKIRVAFVYTGDSCLEIMSPEGEQQSTYAEFLRRNPHGGLHHIAYFSADFEKTLAQFAAEGKPLRIVQDLKNPASGESVEIYCEPVGVENPILFQFVRPGVFDAWFDAMKEAADKWDGSDPIRDARPLLAAAMAKHAA